MLRELEGWIIPKNLATDRAKELIAKKSQKFPGQVICRKCRRWEYKEFMYPISRKKGNKVFYLYICNECKSKK